MRNISTLQLREGRHPGSTGPERHLRRLATGHSTESSSRNSCRPLHRWARGLRDDESHWNVQPIAGGETALDHPSRRVPVPSRIDRRGVRIARPRRTPFHRDLADQAQLSIFRLQGGSGQSRQGMGAHLRSSQSSFPHARTITDHGSIRKSSSRLSLPPQSTVAR